MDDLIIQLKRRLIDELPGEKAQILMAPRMRPGMEDALSKVSQARQSAVLLYLFPYEDDWRIVLMKRTDCGDAHSGQVSIPGGRLESGEDHTQAALREFEEETGVCVQPGRVVGQLSELYIPTSNFLVRPFVAGATEPPRYQPDPVEVAQIIELPFATLLDDATVKRGKVRWGVGARLEAPYFDVADHQVWGATAMILSEFKMILRDLF